MYILYNIDLYNAILLICLWRSSWCCVDNNMVSVLSMIMRICNLSSWQVLSVSACILSPLLCQKLLQLSRLLEPTVLLRQLKFLLCSYTVAIIGLSINFARSSDHYNSCNYACWFMMHTQHTELAWSHVPLLTFLDVEWPLPLFGELPLSLLVLFH